MIERIAITDRAQWLDLRRKDVTASVVGALFGVHPQETIASVWAEKQGMDLGLGPDQDSAVIRRGNALESVVASEIAQLRPNWKISKAREYLRDPGVRLGATPDFLVGNDPRGRGVLQVKTVGSWQFKQKWLSAESEQPTPPLHYSLQVATEAMLDEAAFGVLGVLVVGDFVFDVHIIDVPRLPAAEQRILNAVKKFWAESDSGKVPEIDPRRDTDLVKALYPHEVKDKIIDLTGDNRILDLLDQREALADTIKFAEGKKVEAETEIRSKLGDAEAALVRGWRVSLKTQNRKEHTVKASNFRALRATRES